MIDAAEPGDEFAACEDVELDEDIVDSADVMDSTADDDAPKSAADDPEVSDVNIEPDALGKEDGPCHGVKTLPTSPKNVV